MTISLKARAKSLSKKKKTSKKAEEAIIRMLMQPKVTERVVERHTFETLVPEPEPAVPEPSNITVQVTEKADTSVLEAKLAEAVARQEGALTMEQVQALIPEGEDTSKFLTKEDFEEFIRKLNVLLQNIQGGSGLLRQQIPDIGQQVQDKTCYKRLLDEEGNTMYYGEAAPGSSPSAPAWRIQRIVDSENGSDTDTEICWANGTADFTNVWDDRLTYVYS